MLEKWTPEPIGRPRSRDETKKKVQKPMKGGNNLEGPRKHVNNLAKKGNGGEH